MNITFTSLSKLILFFVIFTWGSLTLSILLNNKKHNFSIFQFLSFLLIILALFFRISFLDNEYLINDEIRYYGIFFLMLLAVLSSSFNHDNIPRKVVIYFFFILNSYVCFVEILIYNLNIDLSGNLSQEFNWLLFGDESSILARTSFHWHFLRPNGIFGDPSVAIFLNLQVGYYYLSNFSHSKFNYKIFSLGSISLVILSYIFQSSMGVLSSMIAFLFIQIYYIKNKIYSIFFLIIFSLFFFFYLKDNGHLSNYETYSSSMLNIVLETPKVLPDLKNKIFIFFGNFRPLELYDDMIKNSPNFKKGIAYSDGGIIPVFYSHSLILIVIYILHILDLINKSKSKKLFIFLVATLNLITIIHYPVGFGFTLLALNLLILDDLYKKEIQLSRNNL